MQGGWVERSRDGWRGGWRESGRKRHTPVVSRRGDARRLLLIELERIANGRVGRPGLTVACLIERFGSQHDTSDRNRRRIVFALRRPLELWGHRVAEDVAPEEINRWLAGSGLRAATKQTYLRVLRQVYAFGIDNHLVISNPATRVKAPPVRRSDRLCPFESWQEVERVAEETGRWEPLVILAVDTGARPGELARLEHRHVRGARVYLPGTKTRNAERVVTLTGRGVAAYRRICRSDATPLVFHTDGRPVDFQNWRSRVWQPALERAGLKRRGVYQTRHSFAYFSLLAGVPLSDLAVEMGHASIRLTHESYGHWSDDMGNRAARLRTAWGQPTVTANRPNTTALTKTPGRWHAPHLPHAEARANRPPATRSRREAETLGAGERIRTADLFLGKKR